MGGEGEDLEPLFDYHRVQPSNFVYIDDDDSDVSEAPVSKKAKTKASKTVVEEDKDVKVIEVAGDDDWLPPPPKVVFDKDKESGEDSTLKALRSKKMELLSFTKTVAADVMQEVEESAKREAEVFLSSSLEAAAQAPPPPEPKNDRAKMVITIQDKDGQKQFRVYADEKFERVFQMYTDREKLDPQNLVFIFDGDKIDPSTTPSNLEMEDGDMIEVHSKKR